MKKVVKYHGKFRNKKYLFKNKNFPYPSSIFLGKFWSQTLLEILLQIGLYGKLSSTATGTSQGCKLSDLQH